MRRLSNAARYTSDRNHRCGPRARICFRHHRAAPEDTSAGRISARRRRRGPLHARLRCRPGAGDGTRGNRHHSSDVRRGPAFLPEGPSVRQSHRDPRRHRPDRGCNADGPWPRHADGMEDQRGPRLRIGAIGGKYRRPAPRASGATPDGDGTRPHRGRLADRRRPGHGARARPDSDVCEPASRRRHHARLPAGRPLRSRALGHIAADGRQGRTVHRVDAGRGTTADPVDPALHRAHGIARTVPARRAGDCAGRRIRIDQTVRRVAGAGRVLCRDDAAGVAAQSARCGGIAAAARRFRRAVLRFGRNAVRPASA